MLYVIRCIDKKDHLPVRQENRPAHVEYLKSFGEKLFAAGAILDKAEAEAFAAGDPYAKAGLFEQRSIDRWNKVLP